MPPTLPPEKTGIGVPLFCVAVRTSVPFHRHAVFHGATQPRVGIREMSAGRRPALGCPHAGRDDAGPTPRGRSVALAERFRDWDAERDRTCAGFENHRRYSRYWRHDRGRFVELQLLAFNDHHGHVKADSPGEAERAARQAEALVHGRRRRPGRRFTVPLRAVPRRAVGGVTERRRSRAATTAVPRFEHPPCAISAGRPGQVAADAS